MRLTGGEKRGREAFEFTVVPTVADHKVTNGMVCQICNKDLVVK